MTSLKARAVAGAKWTAVSTLASSGLQFAQLAVLARLLTPGDFGLMAMALVAVGFAQTYADMGISNAIIHRQDATRNQLSSLYWLNIMAGIVVFIAVIAAVPLISGLFREPRLAVLLPWAACVFLLTPWGHQFQILLQKDLSFKTLAVIEIACVSAGFAASVAFALSGRGVFSLVYGQLVQSGARALLLSIVGFRTWPPRLRFRIGDLRGYLRFGLYQMGEKTVTYFSAHLDKLMIGSLLGAQALGYYSLAWNLVIQPIVRINPIITRVSFPVFSMLQSDIAKLRKGYLDVLRILSAVNFPLLFGLAASAPVLVPVVFGLEWTPAVVLVQILAGVAVFRAQGNPVGSLLLAKGRADLGFWWNTFKIAVQVPAVYAGAKILGINGVAAAILALQPILLFPSYHFLLKPLIRCDVKSYLGAMSRAFALSFLMALPVFLLTRVIAWDSVSGLFALVFTGAIIYAALNAVFNRALVRDIARMAAETW